MMKRAAMLALMVFSAGVMVACDGDDNNGGGNTPSNKVTSGTFELIYYVGGDVLDVYDLTMEYVDCSGKSNKVAMPADKWTNNVSEMAKEKGCTKAFTVKVAASKLPASASYKVSCALKSNYPSKDKYAIARGTTIKFIPNVGQTLTTSGMFTFASGVNTAGLEYYTTTQQSCSMKIDANGKMVE